MSRTNFDTLLEAGCHFGHLKRKWNPAMAPYIFMRPTLDYIRHIYRGSFISNHLFSLFFSSNEQDFL